MRYTILKFKKAIDKRYLSWLGGSCFQSTQTASELEDAFEEGRILTETTIIISGNETQKYIN